MGIHKILKDRPKAVKPGSRAVATIRDRMLVGFGVVLYALVFNWIYLSYLFPVHEYVGFKISNLEPGTFLLMSLMAILPGLWLPMHLERPSQIIYWMLYLTVYVPSQFIPAYTNLQPPGAVMALGAVMLIGMAATGFGYALPLLKIGRFQLPKHYIWSLITVAYLGLMMYLVGIYWGRFRLVSFQNVYADIRFSGSALAEGNLGNYAIMLLGGAINPFLMAYGIVHKKSTLWVVGGLSQVLLYSTAGQKVYLLSLPIFGLVFFGLLRNSGRRFGLRMVLSLIVLCIGLNLGRQMSPEGGETSLDMACTVLFMRTLGVPGMSTAIYQDFFSDHLFTYYSHVRGVNWILEYPYKMDLGREIGFYYSGNSELNSNAHLWCMDGLAACGLPGILIISILAGLVFWTLDSIVPPEHVKLGSMLCILPAMTMANVSLFTTLWSGGFGLILLICVALPWETTAAVPSRKGARPLAPVGGNLGTGT